MNLQSLIRPKIVWPTIIVLSLSTIILYIFKEKERRLRMAKESELAQTIEAKRVVENKLVDAQREIVARDERIKQTLDSLEKEMAARQEAEARVVMALEEKRDLKARLEELAASMPKGVELEKIVIKASPTLNGRVISFNREHRFVVVDLGHKDNLNMGDLLFVYREDNLIGKVQVEKVEEATSAAVLLVPWQDVEYKENDTVRRI